MKDEKVHVRKKKDGNWYIILEVGKHDGMDYSSAVKEAREIAIDRTCELIIHRYDGNMVSRDWMSSEPFPPV